jgi:DNA-binding transcriptional MerR regulator
VLLVWLLCEHDDDGMSTKLVKKQLDACLRNPEDTKKVSKTLTKRRAKKLHKQAAELLDAEPDKTAQESYKTNIRYFKQARSTQKSTMQLMQQVPLAAYLGACPFFWECNGPLLSCTQLAAPAKK